MAKNQNEIDLEVTEQEWTQLDAALKVLEDFAAKLPNKDKNSYVKAPENAGDWVKRMLSMAEQNLGKLRRDFDPAPIQRDLKLRDALMARSPRIDKIAQAWSNGLFFTSSDSFSAGLDIRSQLTDADVPGVDDNLDEGLQRFFSRSPRKKAEEGKNRFN